jgi:hypothetical protein
MENCSERIADLVNSNPSARKTEMKRIAELDTGTAYDSPEPAASFNAVVEHMATPKGRRQRENWILRRFFEIYNSGQLGTFEWVECGERPDYRVFVRPDSEPLPVEVTEFLDPDRKRDKEFKEALGRMKARGVDSDVRFVPDTPPDYEEQLTKHARAKLGDKFGKTYPPRTWLIVYFNIVRLIPFDQDALAFAVRIIQAAVDTLSPPERIEQLWLLTNDRRIERLRLG